MTCILETTRIRVRNLPSLVFFILNLRSRLSFFFARKKLLIKLAEASPGSSYIFKELSTIYHKHWRVYKSLPSSQRPDSFVRIIPPLHNSHHSTLSKLCSLNNLTVYPFLQETPPSIFRKEVTHIDINLPSEPDLAIPYYSQHRRPSISKANLVLIIIDALSIETPSIHSLLTSWSSSNHACLYNTISPSTVTGASIPSIHTLSPHIYHLIDDYDKWYYDPNLEAISPHLPTLSERLEQFTSHTAAFTSFGKSHPLYGYYRGFDLYENISSSNTLHNPSSIDRYLNYFNSSFLGNYPPGHYTFLHDIGSHPPLDPSLDLTEPNHDPYYFSTLQSLQKVQQIFDLYKSKGIFDETFFIITSDHASSHSINHSRSTCLPYPKKVRVPILLKPTKDLCSHRFVHDSYQSSLSIISNCVSSLYAGLALPDLMPDVKTYPFRWLSSAPQYPTRETLHLLGLHLPSKRFVFVTLPRTSLLSLNLSNITATFIDNQNSSTSATINPDLTPLKESLATYLVHLTSSFTSY